MTDGSIDLNVEVAHSARMYDYLLGGKDNYPADREAAEKSLAAFPSLRKAARANRDFMCRTTRFVARQGVRQFLDIGTGIPTEPNLHQIAQSVAPDSRVVYVDNDRFVMAHARALMIGTEQGRTAYVRADLTDPSAILSADDLRDTLDLSRPVAVSLIAVLHFIVDDVADLVSTLIDPLASGSYLTISHVTTDLDQGAGAPGVGGAIDVYKKSGIRTVARTREQMAGLFAGLDLVDPGIAPISRWHPVGIEPPHSHDTAIALLGGVGVKR